MLGFAIISLYMIFIRDPPIPLFLWPSIITYLWILADTQYRIEFLIKPLQFKEILNPLFQREFKHRVLGGGHIITMATAHFDKFLVPFMSIIMSDVSARATQRYTCMHRNNKCHHSVMLWCLFWVIYGNAITHTNRMHKRLVIFEQKTFMDHTSLVWVHELSIGSRVWVLASVLPHC